MVTYKVYFERGKNEVGTLYFYIYHCGFLAKIKIDRILEKDWNSSKQRVRMTDPRCGVINKTIEKYIAISSTIWHEELMKDSDISFEELISKIKVAIANKHLVNRTGRHMLDKLKIFATNRGGKFKSNTIKKYQSFSNILEEYIEYQGLNDVSFSNIDKEFLDGFVDFVTNEKKNLNSTVAKSLVIFKTFMKFGIEEKYHTNTIFERYKIPTDHGAGSANSGQKILAANMWSTWHLGDPNLRYQSFLNRGRPEFNSFIEQTLLYDQVVVPTQDFLSLTILVGVLGEKAIQDLLATNSLKFTRLKGAFVYAGNGGGILGIEMFKEENNSRIHNPISSDIEYAINWAVNSLEVKPKDPDFVRKILDNTIEIDCVQISDIVKAETYEDVKNSSNLQVSYALQNKDLNRLGNIPPETMRLYGGRDTDEKVNDDIDTYLLLNQTNVELKLMELSGCMDMTTSNIIDDMLKAKFERQKIKTKNSIPILKEIAEIPDFGEAVLDKRIELKDILKIKESKNGPIFRDWFHNNCNGDTISIAKEYCKMLEYEPKINSLPLKALRFLLTTGIGGAAGLVGDVIGATGAAMGLVDSFFIEKWAKGKSPKFFINDLKKISK